MRFDYTPKPCKIKSQKQRREEVKKRDDVIRLAEEAGDTLEAKRLKDKLKIYKSCWRSPNTPDWPALKLVADTFGGIIGVDVTADERRLVPAENHITAEDDFLCKDVNLNGMGSAFMNCDYARPGRFLDKLVGEYVACHIPEAISLNKVGVLSNQGSGSLINAHATGICLWGAGKISPITGNKLTRLAFIDVEDYLVPGSDFDSIFIYFGRNSQKFFEVFKPYGSCWIPVR